MSRGWLVTGTDTGVGKTFFSCALLRALAARGERVGVYKPIETGCAEVDGRLVGEDCERLREAAGGHQAPATVSAFLYPDPAAPLVAAERSGDTIAMEALVAGFRKVASAHEHVLVEGAGGLLVPIGPDFTTAELARELGLPVVVVVGSRLGCINHALLTLEALARRDVPVAGWVLNELLPDAAEELAHATHRSVIERFGEAPLLGVVPYGGGGGGQGVGEVLARLDGARVSQR